MAQQATPKVSIGLPVYNGENYLRDTLASLLTQSYEDFELILCDNASNDATEEICRQAAARDGRVRYYRNTHNIGAAPNYNRAFSLARGEYFRWSAHDDLYATGHLAGCVAALDAAPAEVALIYPRTILIDADGSVTRSYDDNLDLRDSSPHRRLQRLLRQLRLCNPVFGLMRRETLATTGLIGSYVAADQVLLAELCLHGQIWEIPEELFYRRLHSAGSQFAHRSQAEVANWFDPQNSVSRPAPRSQLMRGHLAAIGRAPLSPWARTCCRWTLLSQWLPCYWRVIGGELKLEVRDRILRWTSIRDRVPRRRAVSKRS